MKRKQLAVLLILIACLAFTFSCDDSSGSSNSHGDPIIVDGAKWGTARWGQDRWNE